MSDQPRSEPAVDFGRIQDAAEGDTSFEREVFTTYLNDVASRLERLRAAFARGDADVLRGEAHAIKGGSANVGTTRLHYIAESLESTDTETDADALSDLIVQLATEFQRVRVEIESHLKAL